MTSIRVTDPRRETVGQVDLRRRQLPSGVTRCWSWQGPTNGRTTSEVDPIPWPTCLISGVHFTSHRGLELEVILNGFSLTEH